MMVAREVAARVLATVEVAAHKVEMVDAEVRVAARAVVAAVVRSGMRCQ